MKYDWWSVTRKNNTEKICALFDSSVAELVAMACQERSKSKIFFY